MYILYSLFLFLSLIVVIPLYFVKLKVLKRESLHLKERLGWGLKLENLSEKSVWIHAVSVGEVLSLQFLILKLRERNPDLSIYFSSLTSNGLRVAQEKLIGVDRFFFVPLDFAWVVRKFLHALRPTVLVLAESEFWPRLLREAKKATDGVLLINGRISARSFKKYNRFRFLSKRILQNIDFFVLQTEGERESLLKIGIKPDHLEVVGNLKTEVTLPQFDDSEKAGLKAKYGVFEGHKVVLAGSTHKGEEERLIEAFSRAREEKEDVDFILAPRHPERAEEIERLLRGTSFGVRRRSEVQSGSRWDILILDTLGELASMYAMCDAAFIGGSLIPWGGQNFLEPAFYGKPIFFGPHMDNFQDLADRFVRQKAARIVENDEDLKRMFLFANEPEMFEMGENAARLLSSFQGVTDRTLQRIESYLDGLNKGTGDESK
jgi:3-deoxy-D-manno-octulosonic-acid transferase